MDYICRCPQCEGIPLDPPPYDDDPGIYDDDNAAEIWAEMGGYAAGLPRPVARWERRPVPPRRTEWDDIPF